MLDVHLKVFLISVNQTDKTLIWIVSQGFSSQLKSFIVVLTNKTLRPIRRELEVDEGDVWAADDERDDPDDEDDQQGVSGGQPGGERVEDGHVPGHTELPGYK